MGGREETNVGEGKERRKKDPLSVKKSRANCITEVCPRSYEGAWEKSGTKKET